MGENAGPLGGVFGILVRKRSFLQPELQMLERKGMKLVSPVNRGRISPPTGQGTRGCDLEDTRPAPFHKGLAS